VEIRLNSGKTAAWLQHVQKLPTYLAVYGKEPSSVNFEKSYVALWGFSRCPAQFRHALRTSPELDACRRALERTGKFSFVLPSGGYMFVPADKAELVIHALAMAGIAPRASEVVVSPEFETLLEEALGLVSASENVHRRRLQAVPLDAALADLLRYRNGNPCHFLVGDRVVQGRRTFINIDDHDGTHSLVAASAPDAGGGSHNPRAIASSRLRQWT